MSKKDLEPKDAFYKILGAYFFCIKRDVDPKLFLKTVGDILKETGEIDEQNSIRS